MLKLLLVVLVASNIHYCFSQSITAAQLAAMMPQCKHPEYLSHINAALLKGQSIHVCVNLLFSLNWHMNLVN
jgi:hypothetical protein